MTLFLRTPFLFLCLVLLSWGSAIEASAQENYRVTACIADLNDRLEIAVLARKELVDMGEKAVPGLLNEIGAYNATSSRGTNATLLSAARCLSILAAMENSSARDIAIEILEKVKLDQCEVPSSELSIFVLEALMYLASTCADALSIDAIFRFIEHRPYKWIRVAGGQTRLVIDVFTPLAIVLNKHREDAINLVVRLLKEMPYQIELRYDYLLDNGYSWVHQRYFPGKTKKNIRWLDHEARIRLVLLRWLGELNATSAIPEIEPFLRSGHKAERDYALQVLEKLSN